MAGDLSDEVGFGGFLAAENSLKVPKKNEGFVEKKQKLTQVLRCVFFCWGGIKEELASLKLRNRS